VPSIGAESLCDRGDIRTVAPGNDAEVGVSYAPAMKSTSETKELIVTITAIRLFTVLALVVPIAVLAGMVHGC